MRTIIVDDEMIALKQFSIEAEGINGLEMVGEFTGARDALIFASGCKESGECLDLALLDIEMPEMDGLELMEKLRRIYPKMVIMFVTAHEQYAISALKKRADYYIMKPFSREQILDCVERAGLLAVRMDKRICARTFGRFDLFVDGKLVSFRNSKAKELLALCVDHRGGEVTMEEVVDKLWEDREYDDRVKQRYRTTVMQLRHILREHGVAELFESRRGKCHIDANLIDCDYFDLLDGKDKAIREFDYAYMMEYSWAEDTLGSLFDFLDRWEE